MRILEKISNKLNETFRDDLKTSFKEEFGLVLETSWNIFDMCLSSRREDSKKFTMKQTRFIAAFEKGYLAAKKQVEEGV